MSNAICPVERCDRPRRGDQQVCGACAGQLARALGDVAALAYELDISLSKQSSSTGSGPSNERPLPLDLRASEAQWVLRNVLVEWVRALTEHDNSLQPVDTLTDMARWLLARQGKLTQHPAADEAVDEICAAVRNAERNIDRPPESTFAGRCPDCDTPLYVRPATVSATCRECGQSVDVSEQHQRMRAEVEDLLVHSTAMGAMLRRLGVNIADSTIRYFAQKGRIVAHGRDRQSHPLYRVGDVLKLAISENSQVRGDKIA